MYIFNFDNIIKLRRANRQVPKGFSVYTHYLSITSMCLRIGVWVGGGGGGLTMASFKTYIFSRKELNLVQFIFENYTNRHERVKQGDRNLQVDRPTNLRQTDIAPNIHVGRWEKCPIEMHT